MTDIPLEVRERRNAAARALIERTRASASAIARKPEHDASPTTFTDSDIEAIWARWNEPRPTASLRETLQRELNREPQPALVAEEIMRRWNNPQA